MIAKCRIELDGMIQAEYIPEGWEILYPVQSSAESLVLDKTSEESTLSWNIARPSVSRSFYLQNLDFGMTQTAETPPSSALSKTTSAEKVDFTIDDDAASRDFYQSESASSGEESVYFDAQSIDINREDVSSNLLNNNVALLVVLAYVKPFHGCKSPLLF